MEKMGITLLLLVLGGNFLHVVTLKTICFDLMYPEKVKKNEEMSQFCNGIHLYTVALHANTGDHVLVNEDYKKYKKDNYYDEQYAMKAVVASTPQNIDRHTKALGNLLMGKEVYITIRVYNLNYLKKEVLSNKASEFGSFLRNIISATRATGIIILPVADYQNQIKYAPPIIDMIKEALGSEMDLYYVARLITKKELTPDVVTAFNSCKGIIVYATGLFRGAGTHDAPLFGNYPNTGFEMIKHLETAGVPKELIFLAMRFYGAKVDEGTLNGDIAYNQLCTFFGNDGYQPRFTKCGSEMYIEHRRFGFSIESVLTAYTKAKFVRSYGLGGIVLEGLEADVNNDHKCTLLGGKNYLMKAVQAGLRGHDIKELLKKEKLVNIDMNSYTVFQDIETCIKNPKSYS